MYPSRGCGREMESWSLTELVAAIGDDDERAWSEVVRRLAPAVRSALGRFDVDDELRADAAGETWRVLFERLDTIRDPERLHGWISVVAANQLTSILRHSSRRREVVVLEEVFDAVQPVDEEDRVVEAEVRHVLDQAVSKLSVREQMVIRCRALTDEPEPLESMERRHGIPVGSVGPTLGRGLRKLRRDPQLSAFFAEPDANPYALAEQWLGKAS